MRWDPNKKNLQLKFYFYYIIGGWTHCFTILLSYWFSITTIKNPIVPNKKDRSATPIPFFFLFGGALVIGRRDSPICEPQNISTYRVRNSLVLPAQVAIEPARQKVSPVARLMKGKIHRCAQQFIAVKALAKALWTGKWLQLYSVLQQHPAFKEDQVQIKRKTCKLNCVIHWLCQRWYTIR